MPSFHPRARSSESDPGTSGKTGQVGSDAPNASSRPAGTASPSAVATRASASAITVRYGMPRPACTAGSTSW